jgi:histidine triad (HIT) family protein
MDECVFCRIARGEAPAHVVHEDELVVAFLDNGPIRPGHTQIITREHVPHFDDLSPETAARMLAVAQRFAKAMKQVYGVPRVGFVFTGGDIAHVHAHVVPLVEKGDITSARYAAGPIPTPPEAEQVATLARLKAALAGQGG